MGKITDTPTGVEIIWQLQKLGIALGGTLPKYGTDGDLGPKVAWDSSETLLMLRGVLEKANGGPIALPEPKAPSRSPNGKRIYLEVGHGRKPGRFDPGAAHPGGIVEHSLNLVFARGCQARLEALGFAVTIGDPDLENYDSGKAAAGHDIMVSCHHNAAGRNAQYALALYHETRSRPGDRALASLLAAKMAAANGIDNKGARGMGLSVLSGAIAAGVPVAVLVEPYFIHGQSPDNPAPAMFLQWSDRAGRACADAIDQFAAG